MPIYAYRCESCGHAKDVLQKLSDAPLTQCPQCGAESFRKQVTAAGFQLKGSGWYVTDFRNNGSGAPAAPEAKSGDSGESASSAPAPASPAASETAAASPAPAPAPAAAPAAPSSSSSSSSSGSS